MLWKITIAFNSSSDSMVPDNTTTCR